jgi:hypothetical protein
VVDPDEVGTVENARQNQKNNNGRVYGSRQGRGKNEHSVSSPNQGGVEVGDGDVLDDHVLRAVGDSESLALERGLGPDPDERLVGPDVDGLDGGVVVRDADGLRCTTAPAVHIDGLERSPAHTVVSTRAREDDKREQGPTSWPEEPHVLEAGLQPFSVVVPSAPRKFCSESMLQIG